MKVLTLAGNAPFFFGYPLPSDGWGNPNIKDLKIGLEIEGEIPKELGRPKMASLFHQFLNETAPDNKYYISKILSHPDNKYGSDHQHFSIATDNHSPKQGWQLKFDNSYMAEAGNEVLEFTSTILKKKEDWDLFWTSLEFIKKYGFKESSKGAGLHIHLSWDSELPVFASILYRFTIGAIEKELLSHFHVQQSRIDNFSIKERAIYSEFLLEYRNPERSNQALLNLFNEAVNPDSRWNDRSSILRFTEFNTLEVRLLNSTTDPSVIYQGVSFFSELLISIISLKADLIKLLVENNFDKISLNEIQQVIKVK